MYCNGGSINNKLTCHLFRGVIMSRYNFLQVSILFLSVCIVSGYACIVPDNGPGTADLPPAGCPYQSPDEYYHIIDGLPPGTTIDIDGVIGGYFNTLSFPGGTLGGEVEQFDATFDAPMQGTGQLAGFQRQLSISINGETHSGPRNPGDPVQSFATDWFRFEGLILGDPDFAVLEIIGGTYHGLSSPGQTTLTKLPSGDFAVDSFFDISYEIYFEGDPGGALGGLSGTTNGTIRVFVPEEPYSPVPAGPDFWLTHYAQFEFGTPDLPTLPADFFGPGSDPFDGVVVCKGRPANPTTNTLADTIIERLEDVIVFDPPTPINIEMIELNLISTRPVRVTYFGGTVESFFDVTVELDPTMPSPGQMTVVKLNDEQGVFWMELTPNLNFIFESGGDVYTYSTPLPVTSDPYPWQVYDPERRVRPSCEVPGFYPSGGHVMFLEYSYSTAGGQEISEQPIPGDIDLDNDVELDDLVKLAQRWLIGK
jgi:hypothetical protein